MAVRANANLDVQFCGGAAAGEKLYGSTTVDVETTGLSERFGDARIVASHELHQSHTATSSWLVSVSNLAADAHSLTVQSATSRSTARCRPRPLTP